ncbi:MAG: carboxypeptidase-like regulatory domain-containing protein [Verrucomicrobiia bacterium]
MLNRLAATLTLALLLTGCMPVVDLPEPPPLPPLQQGLQGTARITLKQGYVNPLDGMEILICTPDAERPIIETRNAAWLERATPRNFGDGYEHLDLVAIGLRAQDFEVTRARTDDFGRYQIELPPGSYLLYAQYRSRYAAGYWLIPFTIQADHVTPLDLDNANMKEVFNRRITF